MKATAVSVRLRILFVTLQNTNTYLRGHFVPEDEKEEKQLALRARSYSIVNDTLYRGGVCAPLLKCISQVEGRQLLQEIHAGMCSSHIGTRALVGKAFREEQAARENAQQMGRTFPGHFDGKTRSLQASHTRRSRRAILLEQRHAPALLCLVLC